MVRGINGCYFITWIEKKGKKSRKNHKGENENLKNLLNIPRVLSDNFPFVFPPGRLMSFRHN